MMDTQPRLRIAMLLYPGLTLLDLIGPQTVFSWFADIHLVWKTKDLVRSDTGIGIQPTDSFDTCPRELDILFVPGGFGQDRLMADAEVLDFLADRKPARRPWLQIGLEPGGELAECRDRPRVPFLEFREQSLVFAGGLLCPSRDRALEEAERPLRHADCQVGKLAWGFLDVFPRGLE